MLSLVLRESVWPRKKDIDLSSVRRQQLDYYGIPRDSVHWAEYYKMAGKVRRRVLRVHATAPKISEVRGMLCITDTNLQFY